MDTFTDRSFIVRTSGCFLVKANSGRIALYGTKMIAGLNPDPQTPKNSNSTGWISGQFFIDSCTFLPRVDSHEDLLQGSLSPLPHDLANPLSVQHKSQIPSDMRILSSKEIHKFV